MKVKKQKLKDIFSEGVFKGEVKFMEPMKNHTSLKIGGPADVLAMPQDVFSLINMHAALKRNKIPVLPLGGGTNILVRDRGIEGVVISSKSFRRIGVVSRDDSYVYVTVEAGALLQRLVHYTKENGYSGIEGFAGIPGTVGGAIFGNAGAFGCEIKDVLVSVEIMDTEGKIKKIKADQIAFRYRSSGILPGEFILSAEIKLTAGSTEEVSSRIEDFLNIKKEKQPIWEPSAGCVFKNPSGVSAGKLIDESGCKGMRIGDVEVSNLHANFFINKGRASASDFIRLMEEVADRVKTKSGILLEPEIKIVGRSNVN
ncbi:MAG: UDP-N-acetylmuramate dehydrogenase [Nitrospira sp.]|nr:UDP-N-acetylmuramate dehydrogenase [Nitrospira sp.]